MSNLKDWVARQTDRQKSDKTAARKARKTKNVDTNKSLMYRLRFAGKYVENKKKTFDRMVKGPDEKVQASRELRRQLLVESEAKQKEARRLKEVKARDKAILRELNLQDFERARNEQSVASNFQEKFGVLSEKLDYLTSVETNLAKKLQQMEDENTKKALANRATPAMLAKDVELLERLVLTKQQQSSAINVKNEQKKERIDGQRMTLVLQKEKYNKMKQTRDQRQSRIRGLLQKEQEISKDLSSNEEKIAALRALLIEDAKQFKNEWKEKMQILHMTQQSKKKEAVQDKAHHEHAAKILVMRKRASQDAMEMNKKKNSKERRQNYIDSMEEAFETIARETGIESLDELVDTFLRSEHRNFSVYQHINELNRNIEEAVAETRVLKTELSRYTRQYSKSGISRTEKVDALNADIHRLQTKTQEFVADTKMYDQVYKKIQPAMLKLYTLMGCDQSAINKELVAHGVNDLNIQSVLGILEQQATTIANLYQKCTHEPPLNTKKSTEHEDENNLHIGLLSTAFSIKAPLPPSLGDFDPDANERSNPGGRRSSILNVTPLNVTKVRLDVKKQVESGNYRHQKARRGPIGNISEEERIEQLKQIKAMQKKLRREKQENSDSEEENVDRRRPTKNPARRSSMTGKAKAAGQHPNGRRGSVGMRRVLV